MNRRQVVFLAFLTLLIMGGLGFYLVPITRDINIFIFLKGQKSIFIQQGVGLLAGFAISLIADLIIRTPYLQPINDYFTEVIGGIKLSSIQIVFVSLCAGVGEELLFRGALQPLLGIWLTSIIFVAIHGYLNPFNLRMLVYGAFMTFAIAGLGYLTEQIGIVSAMVAHTIIDIYLLNKLTFS